MIYIVLDLEWNQPLTNWGRGSRKTGKKLMFDMVQIGAVKLDEQRRMIGSFSRNILPMHHKTLHPRIRRITGLTQDEVDCARAFPEVIRRFLHWCGEDCVLLTWGCDDISVLYENVDFYGFEGSLPDFFDLQPLFAKLTGAPKDRPALRRALKHYHIGSSAEHPFHSAVDDAYYTALVFQRFEDANDIFQYPEKPRSLGRRTQPPRETVCEITVKSLKEGLSQSFATAPPCPVCGRTLAVPEGFAPFGRGGYLAYADCPDHGLIKVMMDAAPTENNSLLLRRSVERNDEQNPAYVRTKHLQWQKKAAQFLQSEAMQ